ncbi:MAG: TlpA disulfide reductase family protein [Eubacteriales bacterium]|nr:TlpA disulfide reductase family protein [Eubacteriales bacterium]
MKKIKLLVTALLGSVVFVGCAKQASDQTGSGQSTVSKTQSAPADQTTGKEASQSTAKPEAADAVSFPDFTLTDYDGKTLTKADLAGKKVVFKFWASWCHVCNETREESAALANDSSKDFTYISVIAPGYSGELGSEEEFKKWYAEQDHNDLPVYFDKDGALMSALGVRAFPSIATMSTTGTMVHFQAGHVPSDIIVSAMEKIQ